MIVHTLLSQVLNVIHLMLVKEPAKRLGELNRNVFIEQKLHRRIKR